MTEEIKDYEAEQIALALKGDVGARLRIEVVMPFFHIITSETKKYGDSYKEDKDSILKAVDVFKEMHHSISHQIALLVNTLSTPGDLGSQFETLGLVMQKIGDITAETLTRKVLYDMLEQTKKEGKPK